MDDIFIKNVKFNFQKLLSKYDDSFNFDESYKFKQNVPILDSSGWLENKIVRDFDYAKFFRSHIHEIRQMHCYDLLLDLFSKNISIRQFYQEFKNKDQTMENDDLLDIREFVESDFIFEILKCYLSKNMSFSFNEILFEKILKDLVNFVKNESRTAHIFFPLYGLSGNFKKIEFSNEIWVSHLNSNQYATVTNMDVYFDSIQRPEKKFRKLRYGVFIKQKLEKNQVISDQKIQDKAQQILNSFRLFKSGSIYLGALYPYSPDFWPRKNLFPPRIGIENPPEELESGLSISAVEIEQIKDFYKNSISFECEKLEKNMNYLLASIHRFNISYDNKHISDKIVDLCISLETLLDDSGNEIALKLSLRLALLLGNTEDERENLWRFIKKCYNVRSEIVHGKKRSHIQIANNSFTDQQIVQKLEDVTRKAITKVVLLQRQVSNQKELIDSLDCSIVNRTKLLKLE